MTEAYRRAGVDLDAAAAAVDLIREIGSAATRPELAEGVGGFAGLFEIGEGRYIAAATDGVGTKLEVARLAGRLDTVGIDLVAMCADDVVCTGAEPLFFLDYLAVGRVEPQRVAAIVGGVAEGCRRAGCALLGGETAEHPGVMAEDQFDLAGFCVGVVTEDQRIGPERVRDGDVLIGLSSTGLHANGFSLVRSILLQRYGLDEVVSPLERPLADEFLEPTAIYAPLVVALTRDGMISAAAHVTGGGVVENLPRALPKGVTADVDWTAWPLPPVFDLVAREGEISEDDMRSTFNLGIGMILIVPVEQADAVVARATSLGHPAYRIGVVRL